MQSASLLLSLFISSAFGASEWETAYYHAYPAKDISKQASGQPFGRSFKQDLPDMLYTTVDKLDKSDDTMLVPYTSLDSLDKLDDAKVLPMFGKYDGKKVMGPASPLSLTSGLFELAMCMANPLDFIENFRDGLACGSGTYSCMSFWGNEINFAMMFRSWCLYKKFITMPEVYSTPILNGYRKYIHSLWAPSWNYFMLATSPARVDRADLITGESTIGQAPVIAKTLPIIAALKQKSDALSFVETEKEKCEAMLSLPDQVKCMVQKMKELANVKVNHSALPKETFEAMKHLYLNQKKDVSLLQNEGLAKLRNGIEDPIPMGYLQTEEFVNPPPSPANPPLEPVMPPFIPPAIDQTPVPYPVGTKIFKSVGIGMFGLASSNRYGWITPGLQMPIKWDTTEMVPDAKSNDGSPGVVYTDIKDTTKFHLYMPGGYFCYNQEMCFLRCNSGPMLCSTKGWEKSVIYSGVFDPENGGLEGWTHSIVGYTTSDCFLGSTFVKEFAMVSGTVKDDHLGSYFMGLMLVKAVMLKYVSLGMGQSPGTVLVISGCSAAAIGLAPIADMLPSLMESTPYEVETHVVADSAPITVGPPPINGEMPLPQQSQALLYMLYINPGLNPGLESTYPTCYAKYTTLCVWSPYVFPYIKSAFLGMHNYWDSFALGNQAGAGGGTLNSTTYVWGLKLTQEESSVMDRSAYESKTLGGGKMSFFGLNCYDHCYIENPWFWLYAPATAEAPYYLWSAKDTLQGNLAGSYCVVRDALVQFNSGCIGQSFTQLLFSAEQGMANNQASTLGHFGFGVPADVKVTVSAPTAGNPNSVTGSNFSPI